MTRTIRRRARIAAAALLLTALTACGTAPAASSNSTPEHTVITTNDDSATDETGEDDTALIIDLLWASRTEANKDSICAGIALFGTDWAADKMRAGAGGDDSIDWQRAAVLVEAKCETR